MKTLLLISTIVVSTTCFGQNSLDTIFSKDICDCISRISNLKYDDFINCLEIKMQKDSALIVKEYMTLHNDTSSEAGYRFGQELANRILVSMIYSCESYYNLIDTLRYTSMRGLDIDSIKTSITSINKTSIENRNIDFFNQRGVMYFQIHDLENALKDFDSAIKLNHKSLQGIFFKAWTLELMNNYDEAFLLYSQLAVMANQVHFNIFAAIAKKKKNGL